MTALARTALGLGVLAALGVPAAAWIDTLVFADGVERLKPPDPVEVRAEVATWPPERRESTAAKRLLAAADRAEAYAAEETRWGAVVAGVLTEAQRREGLAKADRATPDASAPSGDRPGDAAMTALARILLDRYGYAEGERAAAPADDPWAGIDRQTRAAAVRALAEGGGLEPEQAHVILRVTLELLRAEEVHAQATREMATGG